MNNKNKNKFLNPVNYKYKYPLLEMGLNKTDLKKGIDVLNV